MEKPAARGGRCGRLPQFAYRGLGPGRAPRVASPSAFEGTARRAPCEWAGRPIFLSGKACRRGQPAPLSSRRAPVTIETKSVLFNAVPLFAIAAAYAGITVLTLPAALRRRWDSPRLDLGLPAVSA